MPAIVGYKRSLLTSNSTPFVPGNYPGEGSDAFHPTIDGTWKNFVTDYSADPTGVANSSPALDLWLTYAIGQGSTPVKLYVPPGSYRLDTTNGFTNGVHNATVTAWGATVGVIGIGTFNTLRADRTHSARITSAAIGDTSVTLSTPAQISRFSVGQWILVTGLELQSGATYPPNFQYFEYKQITNITGGVVSFTAPLIYGYKSTWPEADPGHVETFDTGGPATIYALTDAWDCTCNMYGLNVTNPIGTNVGGGRNVLLYGMTFTWGPSVSLSQTTVVSNCVFSEIEVDKLITDLTFNSCPSNSGVLNTQSASVTNMTVSNSPMNAVFCPKNTTIINSPINELRPAPTFFGASETMTITNSPIQTAVLSGSGFDPSLAVWTGSGTFRVANVNATILQWVVPGHVYSYGYYDGVMARITNLGTAVTFQVTDLRQDASYIYIDTDLASNPTGTFTINGHPPNSFCVGYGGKAITQDGSSGPANVTLLQEPAPAPSAWTPASLPGLVAWFEAGQAIFSDAGITPATNGLFRRWNDLSGNGYHCDQPTSANRLTFQSSGAGGTPSVILSAAAQTYMNTILFASSRTVAMGTGTTGSCFILGSMSSATSSNGRAVSYLGASDGSDAGSSASAAWLLRNGTSNAITTYRNGFVASEAISLNTMYRIGSVFDGTNETIYINNVAGTPVANSAAWTSPGFISIGSEANAAPGAPFDGEIKVIVITTAALDSGNRLLLENYLQTK